MPLWVKVFIVIGIVGAILLVAVAALGGTEHGPRRHFGGDESPPATGSHTPPPEHGGTYAPAPAEPAPEPDSVA